MFESYISVFSTILWSMKSIHSLLFHARVAVHVAAKNVT
jgi:hypothetical protein